MRSPFGYRAMTSPLAPFPSDRIISLADMAQAYDAAIARLVPFGLVVGSAGRLEQYRRTIHGHAMVDVSSLSTTDQAVLANALYEASVVVDIASLPESYLDAVRERLRKIGKGNVLEDVTRDDPGRNVGVELQVAARCHGLGTLGPPARDRGDVIVESRFGSCDVEVKRVSSMNGLPSRLHVAAGQLKRNRDAVDPGVVLLDISSACRERIPVTSHASDVAFREAAAMATTAMIGEYVLPTLERTTIDLDRVRGIVVRNSVLGWVGAVGVRRMVTTQAFPVCEPHSAGEKIFLAVSDSLEAGRAVAGTDEQLSAAARRYRLSEPDGA